MIDDDWYDPCEGCILFDEDGAEACDNCPRNPAYRDWGDD